MRFVRGAVVVWTLNALVPAFLAGEETSLFEEIPDAADTESSGALEPVDSGGSEG